MSSQGPITCDSGVDGGGSLSQWTNPNNVTSTSNAAYASVTITPPANGGLGSGLVTCTWKAGDFSIDPLAAISGFAIGFNAEATVGDNNARLLVEIFNNLPQFAEKTTALTTSWAAYTLGGQSDTWQSSGPITGQLFNGGFACQVGAEVFFVTGTVNVYDVTATVYYTPGAPPAPFLDTNLNDFMSMPVAILNRWTIAPTTFKQLSRKARDWFAGVCREQGITREQLETELAGFKRIGKLSVPLFAQRGKASF